MDLNWPQAPEHLFPPGGDYQDNACPPSPWTSLPCYGENYKDAADALIKIALDGTTYLDVVVNPAVFLYRHYLELTLKDIIFRTRRLEHEGDGFPKTHSLKVLWAQAKRLLLKHYGGDSPKEIAYLDPFFLEFHEHDPNSMAFRYPFDKAGNKHLMKLSRINIRHLMETMARIGGFLSCIASDIEDRLQSCSEI
jgi:hypothetical protein